MTEPTRNKNKSLRGILTEQQWETYQTTAAEFFNSLLNKKEKHNNFEKWLLENWNVKKKIGVIPRSAPTGINWAVTMAGAVIPLMVPATVPVWAIILVSLGCGAGAKILGDQSEHIVRDSIERSTREDTSLDLNMLNRARNTPNLDSIVTGMLFGEGGLADNVKRHCPEMVIHAARWSPQLEYKIDVNRKYLSNEASLYFGLLPWKHIISDTYTYLRDDINTIFEEVKKWKGYGDTTSGQATLATFWLALQRAAFETPANFVVKEPETSDRVTVFSLRGYAVEWDIEQTDTPTLIVWLPTNELVRDLANIIIAERGSVKEAQSQVDDFLGVIEGVWDDRSTLAPKHHKWHPDKV